MEELPLGIIFGVVGAGVAVISIAFAKHHMKKMNTAWQAAARMLGFSFETGNMRSGPRMAGTIEDLRADAYSYTKGSGKSSNRYTRFTVEFPPLGVGLQLSRQAGIGQFLKILGTQDIVIGDPPFDEAFIVKTTNPQAARVLLTPGRTMALNQILAVHPEVVVRDDRIVIDRRSNVSDPDVIVSTLRRLASVANVLTDAGASAEMTSLIERRIEGVMPSDYELDTELPSGIDARISTGEALAAAGIDGIARKIFEALGAELPADPTVTGWSEQVGREIPRVAPLIAPPVEVPVETPGPMIEDPSEEMSQPIEPPTPAPPIETEERSADHGDSDAINIATDLFGENRLSFETAAVFDERYAGRLVGWSGKLRQARIVDHYRVLGDGPFTKAVIDVAQIENDLFGNTVVTAIVALPEASIDSIDVGETIAFSGELVGIDALVRNLFVGGATLSSGQLAADS